MFSLAFVAPTCTDRRAQTLHRGRPAVTLLDYFDLGEGQVDGHLDASGRFVAIQRAVSETPSGSAVQWSVDVVSLDGVSRARTR